MRILLPSIREKLLNCLISKFNYSIFDTNPVHFNPVNTGLNAFNDHLGAVLWGFHVQKV